jgi:imidazolonepropionase-like amidohydrolase
MKPDMKSLLLSLAGLLISLASFCQETFPVNGTQEKDVVYHAFTGATIHVDDQTTLENATMIIRNGRIESVGIDITPPLNSVVHDLEGYSIYPSFIDLNSNYGMPKAKESPRSSGPQYESNRKGILGWNESIKADQRAAALIDHQQDKAKSYRSSGFGSVLTHQKDGIARGSGSLVCLGSQIHKNLLVADASAHYSFRKGTSTQNYPGSLIGAIALLRQTYYDAAWYESELNTDERNLSLSAWNELQSYPQFFEVGSHLDILRADKVGDEFNVQYVFAGKGDEYRRIEDIKNTEGSMIIPLNFPAAFDVSDPYLTRLVSLKELKHWELAPSNPARLEQAGIKFAITSEGVNDAKTFLAHVRKAIEHGLSQSTALRALTTVPAEMIGAQNEVGALRDGMQANFLVTSGELFAKGTVIHENWVQGEAYVLAEKESIDLAGSYNLNLNKKIYPLEITGAPGKQKASIELIQAVTVDGKSVQDTSNIKVQLDLKNNLVNLQFNPKDEAYNGVIRLAGVVYLESRIWEGKGQTPEGEWIEWVAVRQNEGDAANDESNQEKADSLVLGSMLYPMMAYGFSELPEAETVLIQNATVWTCEEEGILEKANVLIHDGKIAAVGKEIRISELFPKQELSPVVIDAKGKHVTPGIIDEHSHIAVTRGVNEGTQASSAEVQIGTAINSDDINIYRQLAGGVTASQLLHGSANPIGGQSAMIKLRWGHAPEALKVEGADPFIKFALGENVKQSNWGDKQTTRFPQTRMGVEQVYYDHFIKAREYDAAWNDYRDSLEKLTRKQRRKGILPNAPRRDLELETLAQIVRGERYITCHSYRQDEINMLMHVADSMGFRLNTFTHVLEGYKVADKMKAHGAGGSSFSDWWAYKFEVKDAIPYNGALLWEQGITTAFNSDDREMARRLNQEAAKAVKYGGVPEQEALKFVTLNPAKLLHLDDRMGSIKVGKDADIVLWSDHPLSVYAKAEKTFVDGICYYDAQRDLELREEVREERARIIQLMLNEKDDGKPKRKPTSEKDKDYHCDTIYDEMSE